MKSALQNYLDIAEKCYMLNPPRMTVDRTYGDVPNPDTRQMREFNINGQKIMAYSHKDAITRLKYRKKLS